jgi:hypothetical protein
MAQVTLDQQLRELRLSAREQTAVLLELARARTRRAQLLALGHDAADLGGERLDGVGEAVHAPQATVPPG